MNAKTVSWLCEKKSDSDVMMATWSTYLIFKFCGCLISVECKIEFNLNVTFFYYWSKTWNFKWSSFIDGLKLGTLLREIVIVKKAVFKKFVEDIKCTFSETSFENLIFSLHPYITIITSSYLDSQCCTFSWNIEVKIVTSVQSTKRRDPIATEKILLII